MTTTEKLTKHFTEYELQTMLKILELVDKNIVKDDYYEYVSTPNLLIDLSTVEKCELYLAIKKIKKQIK